ncbi:Endonuclease/Exonuclease/phosphatase family protein [Allorhodopirellula solitaria]|uniref:Endonuclease/Exonuclease/phosphatase family protein n=2 Tax=Allorhodopirellula solitaria TaxID=2527987 RepID=A0A5C5YI14_9BACT|nr:Endonuclease/Exonuclease/phosphatase family protein [Allorhodopirellula solitaria]
MSFNIRYGKAKDGENHWEKRKLLVAQTIQAFSPDLLGTQETLGFQKQFLEGKLPEYASIGIGRQDGGQQGEMTAIFYRSDRFERLDEGHFWLSETPEVVGSKSWDSSLPRMCSWVKLRDRRSDGPAILFVNTHFDHRGPDARKESARLLGEKISDLGEGCRCVLTGDFNAGAGSQPHQILFAESSPDNSGGITLVDTFAAAHPDATDAEATFSGFRPNVTKGARIDWIAVTPDWTIESAEIDRTEYDGRTPSDHYPITATLRFTDDGSADAGGSETSRDN